MLCYLIFKIYVPGHGAKSSLVVCGKHRAQHSSGGSAAVSPSVSRQSTCSPPRSLEPRPRGLPTQPASRKGRPGWEMGGRLQGLGPHLGAGAALRLLGGLISSTSTCVTCLANLLFRSLHYRGSELLLCPRPSPRVALPCHVIHIRGRSYGSPDALRGLGSPAPASGSSRIFLDLTSHAEALVPEASLSAAFTGHPTLRGVLLFLYLCLTSQEQLLEGTTCVSHFLYPLKHHTRLHTTSVLCTIAKASVVCISAA